MQNKKTVAIGLVAFTLIVCTVIITAVVYIIMLYSQNDPILPDILKPDNPPLTRQDNTLINFETDADLKKFLTEVELKREYDYFGAFGSGTESFSGPQMNNINTENPFTDGADKRDYSQTNVQELGIDEPDIVKTNGSEIFISNEESYYPYPEEPILFNEETLPSRPYPDDVNQEHTKVINGYPLENINDLRELKQIPVRGDLLLDQDILVVLNYDSVHAYRADETGTELWNMDYVDDVYYQDARTVNGSLFLILEKYIYRGIECPVNIFAAGEISSNISCRDIYSLPNPNSVENLIMIMELDLETGAVLQKTSFLTNNSPVVYMSMDNLYLGISNPPNTYNLIIGALRDVLSELGYTDLVARIDYIDSLDVSQTTKMMELQITVFSSIEIEMDDSELENLETAMIEYASENIRNLSSTDIIKLGVDNFNDTLQTVISGVPLNQFSFNEYNGNLRVSVTHGNSFDQEFSINDLYILDQDLNLMGSVENMGKGESVYATRYIGDQAFVVTFREIDPFYVLDLSDPNSPFIAGELKIPGYSSYLHPLSDELILGIGKENNKVKLSMFSVADPNNPQEVSKLILDEFWSEAVSNHRAFMYDSRNEYVFIPGDSQSYIISVASDLTITKQLTDQNTKRALYIEGNLYTVSDSILRVYDINRNFEQTNALSF